MAYYEDGGNDGQPFGRGQGGTAGPRRPSMCPGHLKFCRTTAKSNRARHRLWLVNDTMDAQPATKIQGGLSDGIREAKCQLHGGCKCETRQGDYRTKGSILRCFRPSLGSIRRQTRFPYDTYTSQSASQKNRSQLSDGRQRAGVS